MKNDQYLNLCLEQAALSPLHYRHGSIVVKGGKVIGQGFNDYRSGFDGGSLKTGQLPAAAFPLGDAVAEFKRKRKSNRPDPPSVYPSAATFTPFDRASAGGHRHANMCLSMHSEMMAIHSALAASSTLAASTASRFKPGFKLSDHHSKHGPSRGGNDAVKSFNGVPARLRPKSGVLKPVHLDATVGKNNNRNPNTKQNQNQNHGRKKNKESAGDAIRTTHTKTGRTSPKSISHGSVTGELPIQNHILLPKSRGKQSRSVVDRMKHPKLVGADVYVARLSNSSSNAQQPSCFDSLPDSEIPAPTGSLHDELVCKTSCSVIPPGRSVHLRSAVDSRPCYRCVCYMHSVGIKRVFWTNGDGDWEGAKVRDLVDMLEGSSSGDEAVAGLGVFVTKHEVLMLRRLMGG